MKKGFTLIELLAVIVILSLVALIVGTGVTNIIKKSKKDLSDIEENSAQRKLIIDAAKIWATNELAKNNNTIPDEGCINLEISTLKNAKLINFDTTDYYVKVCSTLNEDDNQILTYELTNH